MEKPLIGKNVAILVASGFEEVEMTEAQRALLKLGAAPKIVSPDQGLVNGWHGTAWGHYFPVDVAIGEALAVDYDMLLLPGGERSVAKLTQNPHTRRILASFLDSGRPIAAIGQGVALLALGEKIKGRTLACANAARTVVEEAGATWSEEPVAVDGGLVSAKGQEALSPFIEQMIKVFVEAADIKRAA